MPLLVSNLPTAPSPAPVIKSGEFISLTLRPQPGEEIPALCRRLAARLHEHGATPLQMLVFGQTSAAPATHDALQKVFSRVNWPVTRAEGAACDHQPIAGIQVHAFSGEVERIQFGGRVVGSVFTDGGVRQC